MKEWKRCEDTLELSRNVNYDVKRLEIVQHARPLQSNEGEGKLIVTWYVCGALRAEGRVFEGEGEGAG